MQRRDFIKFGAGFGAEAFFLGVPRIFSKNQAKLPIPPLIKPDANKQIALNIMEGNSRFRGTHLTKTWGFNGALLGPVLHLTRGSRVSMMVSNQLSESTTVHWHGLAIPGNTDGGPQELISPGKTWESDLKIDQPAATCWYHPHPCHDSGRHVAMGLAGIIILEDEESQELDFPKTWGVDDVPVILQDKRLNGERQIDYQLDVISAAVGWFGDLMLTNGTVYPEHHAPRGWLRLRFLNGCNARSLKLATSDGRAMYVIASDGGYLAQPVKLTELPILMGERFEVLVDTSDGKPFDIVTLPVTQIGMVLEPFDHALSLLKIKMTSKNGHKKLPENLAQLPPIPVIKYLPQRHLKLSMDPRVDMLGMQELIDRYGEKAMAGMSMDHHRTMDMDDHKKHNAINHGDMSQEKTLDLYQSNFINGRVYDMKNPMFDVKKGRYERWTISGEGDMMVHPFHIHGTQFRILTENGKPPSAHRSGWKDIVCVEGAVSEVLVKFDHLASAESAYMAHCHLLEHEDTGMMMSFTVSA